MAEQIQDNNRYTATRLPTDVLPLHYDLYLKPDLQKFTFEGNVGINYELKVKLVKEIVLNSKELVISEGYIQTKNSKHPLTKVIYSKDSETATLEFGADIEEDGQIFLKFTGTLNDQMKGFYRSGYKVNDNQVYAATTQFEAIDARMSLPCWDEPAVKSTFSVTLCYDPTMYPSMVALSNTPVISESQVDKLVNVTFAKTPKMSIYLLAYIIGSFEYIEQKYGDCLVRVYTTPGKKEQGRFALDVACKSLEFYENYFDIKYPLEKMDLIAIPDFASGAMENWGLVTYRETCLLFDPNNTSTTAKQYVALVVAHELAHQWFGNLVTMEWWTHLWLNEGFATFMEFLCIDNVLPDYDIWSQFVTSSHSSALNLDALSNSHPIEVPINHPSEIDEIFDQISYEKGSSVIRMLYSYIGDESFRKGMKDYLTKFAYKNAQTEDLWAALEAASNKPICKLMSGWTSQKGFPWLSVSFKDNILYLTQEKFAADGTVTPEDANTLWQVPISTITNKRPNEPSDFTLLGEKTGTITMEGEGLDWIKLNPGSISFYRTAYSESMAKNLFTAIGNKILPAMDRLGIQNDSFALCQAGKIDGPSMLNLLQAYKGETDYTVWSSIDGCIGKLSLLLSNTDYHDQFQLFGRDLYSEIFKRLTWDPIEGEKHTDALTRALVVERLVSLKDEHVIEHAKKLYKAQLADESKIPADFRSAVYKAISNHGDEEEFNSLFGIYEKSDLNEEKNRVLRALGTTKDTNRQTRSIEFALSDKVRNQDKISFLLPLGATNTLVAWKLFQERVDYFKETLSGRLLTYAIKGSIEHFATEEKYQEVSKYFQENKFPSSERTIQQSLEKIRLNTNWLARDADKIKNFLATLVRRI